MARLVQYATAAGQTSSTSSSYSDHVTITASLTSGKTYVLFWSALFSTSDVNTFEEPRLQDTTGGVTLELLGGRARDTTDKWLQGGICYYTAVSTASRSFAIQVARTVGAGTVYLDDGRILILELGPNDKFATTTLDITTSTSLIDLVSLTFTPATSGDYLFLASAQAVNNKSQYQFVTPGGTVVNDYDNALRWSETVRAGFVTGWVETLAASSQTARIKYRSTSGAAIFGGDAFIIALRISDLINFQYSQTDTDDGGTQATYQVSRSLSATGLQAGSRDTVAVAIMGVSGSSTTISSYFDVREAGTVKSASIFEPWNGNLEGYGIAENAILAYKVSNTSSSIAFDIRRKSETTGTTTTVRYAGIFVFETPPDLSGVAALTESDDSVSSAGTLALKGTASLAESDDSTSATGTLAIKGASAQTEADDSVSSTGQHVTSAAAAITEADDSVSATATLAIAGAASITEADDTTTATGNLPIVGQNALTEADDSVTAEGTLLIHGASALAEAEDSVSAAGSLYIAGLADLIESDDSVDANDFVPRGHAVLDEDEDFIVSTGRVPLEWLDALATRHDVPNRTLCAVCARPVLPETMHRQVRRVGQRLVWTGLYTCQTCIDIPGDPPPIHRHADPRPVPNARPSRS